MPYWEGLFADLASQAEAAEAAELAGEVAERTRGELGRLRLTDRLRPGLGHPLTVGCGGTVSGRLRGLGPDWLLLAEDTGSEVLIPLAAVLWVQGAGAASAEPGSEGPVQARVDLRLVLRGLVRDRAAAAVVLRDGGPRTDATTLTGVLDRVGADHLELATTAPGEQRRRDGVRGVRLVPLGAIALLRRR